MRMIAGSVLILAGAVCAAGYQVAQAFNKFSGGPLPFLSWVLVIGGATMMARAWMAELPVKAAEGEKAAPERKK